MSTKTAHHHSSSMGSQSDVSAPLDMPILENSVTTDVVIIGAGLLGLSTALHLAKSGVNTVVLEKGEIGGRASGRNGGQLTPGMARWKAQKMLKSLSLNEAQWLWRFSSCEAMELIDELLDSYQIDAEKRIGHLTAAIHPAHIDALVTEHEARVILGEAHSLLLNRHELATHLCSPAYDGAMLDNMGGQINPQKMVNGLARAFYQHGGIIHTHSPVLSLRKVPRGTEVVTAAGAIVARKAIVMAMHTETAELQPAERAMSLSLYSYVSTTWPVTGGIQTLLPTRLPVYDTRLQIDYFRPYDNERLLFGALGTSHLLTADIFQEKLQRRMQEVFPRRTDLYPETAWVEEFDVTHTGLPVFRKSAASVPIYSVYGWNGHGVAQAIRSGKAIRDDFLNINNDYMKLTQFEHRAFPIHLLPKGKLAALALFSAKLVNFIQPEKMLSS